MVCEHILLSRYFPGSEWEYRGTLFFLKKSYITEILLKVALNTINPQEIGPKIGIYLNDCFAHSSCLVFLFAYVVHLYFRLRQMSAIDLLGATRPKEVVAQNKTRPDRKPETMLKKDHR